MTVYVVEAPSRVPTTAGELRPRLAAHGVELDDVVSLEVTAAVTAPVAGDCPLWVKATTFARDPLGQRFQLFERDAAPRMATEVRFIPWVALLG